ncbi:MAG: hypothetical protein ACTSR3_23430, partial [Candidatus Helarchaeota archaeon]
KRRGVRKIRLGFFPNQESYVCLISSYLIEYSEDWISERSYIKQKSIDRCFGLPRKFTRGTSILRNLRWINCEF